MWQEVVTDEETHEHPVIDGPLRRKNIEIKMNLKLTHNHFRHVYIEPRHVSTTAPHPLSDTSLTTEGGLG